MDIKELHHERDRAESFGNVADDYDRHRPEFSPALYDEIAKLGTGAVLDVGCGTGKIARGLIARGRTVLGVELDARMAEVARHSGVPVEVARFEEWADAGRRFGLVTCGDAWHWIDPVRGAAKVATVLEPGGAFMRTFNMQLLDEPVVAALAPAYATQAPGTWLNGQSPPLVYAPNPFPLEGPFTPAELTYVVTERFVDADGWIGFLATISDHQKLGAERLGALLGAARAALVGFGDQIRVRMITTVLLARRIA